MPPRVGGGVKMTSVSNVEAVVLSAAGRMVIIDTNEFMCTNHTHTLES